MHLIHQYELSLIHALQFLRSAFLDQFFIFLNFFDTGPFYILLVAVIWFSLGEKLGRQIFYISMLTFVSNMLLKDCFSLPRPGHVSPQIAIITASSYGFPSGAAQAAVSIFGLIALRLKKKAVWVAVFLYIALICLSRVYLGMHFFSDIVGGLFFGVVQLLLFCRALPYIESVLQTRSRRIIWSIAFLTPWLVFIALPVRLAAIYAALLLGVQIGSMMPSIGEQRPSFEKIYFLTGMVGILLIGYVPQLIATLPLWGLMLQKALLGWYLSYGARMTAMAVSPSSSS